MEHRQTNSPVVQDKDRGKTTYKVAGEDVTLSYPIVRDFLTKGDGKVTDQDLTQFICICKYNQLNPFLKEAYLIKFGNSPAQMVVSKEALMKRAEQCAEYDGFKAGLIIKRGNDIIEVEGNFSLPTDVLLGGWAEVHRKDRKFPYVSRVSLSEYDKKQALWNEKKSTMIRKTAIVQALREAFPTQLGAMYTAEEQGVQDVPYEDVTEKVKQEVSEKANTGTPLSFAEASEPNTRTEAPRTEAPRTEAQQQQGAQPDF
ncbi:MAG: phage recombination protein Bet [Dysgonamonadaceae bacterium]|jgi:phage recombination protein Bet|nr:phage recombination protein Bet [Dysgonamonadaceae bacterium]